ncbi:MAG: phenylalanine--tRNA ligase subunit beta [Bacteroidota bacterium]|nr:phenylalanine--tRNA ligase subunit beta [Bacteroidota bacterium]
MKISYNWLKNYINLDKNPQELSEILTNCGLEVEGLEKVESIKGGLNGIVVGEVLTCKKHPNADKLSVTTVNVGRDEALNIVCGAPNVAAGQKVIVATVGAVMYSGDESFKIKKAKMRGEPSEGMICAEDELGLGVSHDGIMVLDSEAKPGTAAKAYFNIEEDYVFEIGLTPNRSDATSHIGTAKDLVAAINNLTPEVELPENEKMIAVVPSVKEFKVENNTSPIDVVIEDTQACPRYSGVTVSDIKVTESPEWLKTRLNSIGIRPINNLVDISNYVLFETGQPLHFFDADFIKGDKIIVKKLEKNTKFTTLDEIERTLSDEDLMICNAEKPMCIAGVFGGLNYGVTEKTTKVFIESAYFDAPTVRKTSKRHTLQTDASFRFERGADFDNTVYALKRAALLIKEIAGGKISSEIVDVYPNPIQPNVIEMDYNSVLRLIGKTISHDNIKRILTSLEFVIIEESEEKLKLRVPTNKVDVTREADLVEEIIRIYGYNNIDFSEKINSSLSYQQKPDADAVRNIVSDYLTNNGYYEIMNNSLTKGVYADYVQAIKREENVEIVNPLSSELNVMRQSLLFGGLESVAYNINRKQENLKFYEFGNIYRKKNIEIVSGEELKPYEEQQCVGLFLTGAKTKASWMGKPELVTFYDLKSAVYGVLGRLGINIEKLKSNAVETDYFSEGILLKMKKTPLVEYGVLNKKILKRFDVKQEVLFADFNWDNIFALLKHSKVSYQQVSKFPEVRRDLALVIDAKVSFAQVEEIAQQYGGKILKEVGLFDIYQGDRIAEGKKSYSVSFILQKEDKTLKDKEIEKFMNKLITAYESKIGAEIRK